MTVYVDTPAQYTFRPTERYSGRWCHITADDRAELHAFVERLGLKRAWFQDHPTLWHYDLTVSKHVVALRLGAVAVGRMEMGRLMRKRAQNAQQGDPS